MKRRHPRPTRYGFVYYVGGEDGPIKIGFTDSPKKRLATLQTGSPFPLRYLALTEGSTWLEAYLHDAFAIDRLSGEWFARTPKLMQAIAFASSEYGMKE